MSKGLHNNWITCGLDNDVWSITWSPATRTPVSFREECVLSAKLIGDSTTEKIKVLMSGGKDSELTARSFIEAGIDFEGAVVRHENDSNLYDIAWAIIFCEENNVNYKIYDIAINDYYNNDKIHNEYSKYDRTSEYSSWLWVVDQVGGFCIGSNGGIYDHLYRLKSNVEFELCSANNDAYWGDYIYPSRLVDNSKGIIENAKWFYGVSEQLGYCWDARCNYENKLGLSSFLSYTPEQLLSQFLDPFTTRIFNNEFPDIYIAGQLKNEFYITHWPDMIPRKKYTGNERIFNFPEYKKFLERHKNTLLSDIDIVQRRILSDDFINDYMGNICTIT